MTTTTATLLSREEAIDRMASFASRPHGPAEVRRFAETLWEDITGQRPVEAQQEAPQAPRLASAAA